MFETSRLRLRRFTMNDADFIFQLNSDPEVLKYLHEPAIETIERAEEILKDVILPQYELQLGRWAVFTKADNRFIGWCGLKSRPDLNEIDLGYRFLQNEWGNGYATEASKATIQYGITKLRIKTITGRAHIHNTASVKVLEKSGMKFLCQGIVDNAPVKTYIITEKMFLNL